MHHIVCALTYGGECVYSLMLEKQRLVTQCTRATSDLIQSKFRNLLKRKY